MRLCLISAQELHWLVGQTIWFPTGLTLYMSRSYYERTVTDGDSPYGANGSEWQTLSQSVCSRKFRVEKQKIQIRTDWKLGYARAPSRLVGMIERREVSEKNKSKGEQRKENEKREGNETESKNGDDTLGCATSCRSDAFDNFTHLANLTSSTHRYAR